MNKRTKFVIGVSLVVSAITTMFAFLALCIKKKNAWEAILALAATEGLVGLALMEDKIPPVKINKPKKVKVETDEEIFGGEDVEDVLSAIETDLGTADGETSHAPKINQDIPRDDEATEEDFT